MAIVGALTAIFAASIGLVQNDIKRVLAYSTVSQLGYMFLGCGVGAFTAGIFHLMTHAFFKALLFLGSGSVIHALGGEQDIRKMGSLKDKIKTTWWTMLVGTVAIAGFPPLAGFFSKDEILWKAFASERGHWLLWLVGAVAAGMTSFYMFRMMFLTFYGKSRMTHEVEHHVHESPASMTLPLQVLAVGSVVAGWLGIPHVIGHLVHVGNAFEHFLEPVFEHPVKIGSHGEESLEWLLMGVSVAIALAGLMLARQFYLANPALPENLMNRFRGLYTTLLNKYWVDEIYDALIVNRTKGLGTLLARFDLGVIDGGVNGSAWLTRTTASVSGFLDFWVVDFAVRRSDLIYYLSYPIRRMQTGVDSELRGFHRGRHCAAGKLFRDEIRTKRTNRRDAETRRNSTKTQGQQENQGLSWQALFRVCFNGWLPGRREETPGRFVGRVRLLSLILCVSASLRFAVFSPEPLCR